MKNLIVYFSKSGNNKFLAEKLASALGAPVEVLYPKGFNMLFFLMNLNFGIKPIQRKINDFDRVILVGPVMMGRLIPPLKSFVNKYMSDFKQIVFVTCCGSGDEVKMEKFGHGHVFNQLQTLLGDKLEFCEALPVGLTLSPEQKPTSDAIMKVRLDEANFSGAIAQRFDSLVARLK
ncbi:MAG: hypothetical protein JXR34_13120 [Bacteroidales bacterium]|nr:hypothetical protein [Bacteroidales bacterium]